MTCPTCAQHHTCTNRNKKVVLDTSLLIRVVSFLCRQYETHSRVSPVVASFGDLCSGLEYFLGRVTDCAIDGAIHVSARVLSNEMDPGSGTSTMRTQVPYPPALVNSHPQRCHSQLRGTLMSAVVATPVDDDFLRALRAAQPGANDLSDEDVSLIALAILECDATAQVAVISLDENLVRWGRKVRSRKQLEHAGREYVTARIYPEDGLVFLSAVHECCQLDTGPYEELVEFAETQDIERVLTLNPQTVQRKWRRAKKLKRELRQAERRKYRASSSPATV